MSFIITQGYGSKLVITKGYGFFGIIQYVAAQMVFAREVVTRAFSRERQDTVFIREEQ